MLKQHPKVTARLGKVPNQVDPHIGRRGNDGPLNHRVLGDLRQPRESPGLSPTQGAASGMARKGRRARPWVNPLNSRGNLHPIRAVDCDLRPLSQIVQRRRRNFP